MKEFVGWAWVCMLVGMAFGLVADTLWHGVLGALAMITAIYILWGLTNANR